MFADSIVTQITALVLAVRTTPERIVDGLLVFLPDTLLDDSKFDHEGTTTSTELRAGLGTGVLLVLLVAALTAWLIL